MLDIKAILTKNNAIMHALNGKTLKPIEWTQELAAQVYALNEICLQQQEEIEKLKKEFRSREHTHEWGLYNGWFTCIICKKRRPYGVSELEWEATRRINE